MENNPLVKGGQGRSAQSLVNDAKALAYCVIIAVIALSLAAVTT